MDDLSLFCSYESKGQTYTYLCNKMKDKGQNLEFGSIANEGTYKKTFYVSNIAHLGINIKDVKINYVS